MEKRGKNSNDISFSSLSKNLRQKLKRFDPYNIEILKSRIFYLFLEVFASNYKEFEEIISNVKISGKSDILISYGNNNYASKYLINDIIKNSEKTDDFRVINFNSHIHNTEESVLKKFCYEIDIDIDKTGFDGARQAIEEYYKRIANLKKKGVAEKQDNIFLVIFFENIENLFEKKKQILIYTLLEIISISSNILFCGMTSNFNLTDLMEKRIRSRFSQKTIFIKISDRFSILSPLENIFSSKTKVSLQIFYNIFLSLNQKENGNDGDLKYNILIIIDKYVNLGMNIKEIIVRLKYIISMILMKLTNYNNIEQENMDTLRKIMNDVIREYIDTELTGSYYNLLKSKNFIYIDFSKFHVVLLICLWICVGKYKDKITAGMIYQEYSHFCLSKYSYSNSGMTKVKSELIVVKKALEELFNSNLIWIKYDEKYLQVYELKLPFDVTQKIIENLEENDNFNYDNEMKQFLKLSF